MWRKDTPKNRPVEKLLKIVTIFLSVTTVEYE